MTTATFPLPKTAWPGKSVVVYHPNGLRRSETPIVNGQAHGLGRSWYPNGAIRTACEFTRGVAVATCTFRVTGTLESRERRSPGDERLSLEKFDKDGRLEHVLVGPWRADELLVGILCRAASRPGRLPTLGRRRPARARAKATMRACLSWLAAASAFFG